MQRWSSLLFVSLIFSFALSETFGLVLSAKEKRGWTMNSAGYLLGPRRIEQLLKEMPSTRGKEEPPGEYAIDRVFNDKHGLAGKRDIQPEENIKAGFFGRPLTDANIMHTIIEFLTYLHLKGKQTSLFHLNYLVFFVTCTVCVIEIQRSHR
nr:PREDICTED: galanin peptides isoform X1 [Anolis carolinensis]|eukprot:XP_008106927.1 PREDICTED: galanin peptides isoform X1 [Anolis carolinensis]